MGLEYRFRGNNEKRPNTGSSGRAGLRPPEGMRPKIAAPPPPSLAMSARR